MRRTLLSLMAATCLTVAVPAAALAQNGQSINERQVALDARIDAGVANRSLTATEAANLRSEFAGIARLEERYRASNGLSRAERADLDKRFDLLSRRITYDRNDTQARGGGTGEMNINQRQADLDARIDAGVRNGSLTAREAAELRAEFQAIARQEADYRRSGRGLTNAERVDLDRRFDSLSARVRTERNDNQVRGDGRGELNINQRQGQLDDRIDAGVRNGGLTTREAAGLRAEFQAIARQEAAYRQSGRGLTNAERTYLEQRLDRLERRIYNNRADNDRRWTNLDQRQAGFEMRLDRAVQERRVSSRDAYALKQEYRYIARLERSYRMSRPGITARERADLNKRFDRMEDNFRRSMTPSDNLFDLLIGLVG